MQRTSRAVLRQSARLTRASTKNVAAAASSNLSTHVLARAAAPVSRVNASFVLSKSQSLRSQVRAFSAAAGPVDVPVPSMGDSISEGTVVEWLKNPGDAIAADDVVVVLETDKVSVDVRAPFAGTLVKQLAGIDENVMVGAPLFQVEQGDVAAGVAVIEAANEDAKKSEPEAAATAPTPAAAPVASGEAETVVVPSMGDSISEGTIVSWLKSAGDAVATDDVIVIIETDKVSVDVRAPKSGVIQEVLANVDEVVAIGAPLFKLVPGAAPAAAAAPAASVPAPAAAAASTPAAAPAKAAAPAAAPASSVNPLSFNAERGVRREKMSRMRLRTAERLKESQNITASLTTFQELDMTNIMNLRKTYKDEFEKKHGVKLGFMSAFIKASASALLEVPGVNAMIDDARQEIVYRDYVDMSVAVSTPKGLVTPVLQNTESMGFADIEKKLAELAEKARAGKLTLEEMTGGNFTISNGGVFGSLMGTPIINLPQTAILGMHATKMRPVVHNGQVTARPMMYLALTYDHRLVDGREAVTALKAIADKVENPERLLLDL